MQRHIKDLLYSVQCPSRYIGNEINSYHKDKEKQDVSFALCYPDLYELGMSSLGIRILYGLLNEMEGVVCERVFAPADDMEMLIREKGLPLFSLESGTAVSSFNILGFSLSSGLNYTNMLNILSLSSIPLFSSERGEDTPLVIAGGSCVFNPAPLEPFIDAFLVGEGEAIMSEVISAYRENRPQGREAVLNCLSGVEGVYVPGISRGSVKRTFVRDMDSSFFPVKWMVPLTEIVHDRVSLEIMRGCGHGCRFCQAGACWRPVRKRSTEAVIDIAKQVYMNTGYEEISLLSFSAGDHPSIGDILDGLMKQFEGKKVTISFPSLRIDTFSFELAGRMKGIKKTALTFAPETSSSLRASIGKNIMDEELMELARKARKDGWRHIKLYFMIGLPGETDRVLEEAAFLINELSEIISIKANFNTFVPKAHTPFQNERFITRQEFEHKKHLIVNRTKRNRYIKLSFQSYDMGYLENLLGRGDLAVSGIIYRVWRSGGKMENWSEQFSFSLWEQAAEEVGMSMDSYLATRKDSQLPWHMIRV